jgi:hypothetical protein
MTNESIASALTYEQEKELRAKIVEANPKILRKERKVGQCIFHAVCSSECGGRKHYFVDTPRDFRLADAVLAIHVKTGYDSRGHHGENAPNWSIAIDDLVNCHWDHRNDSLDDQSDSCKKELYDLLCTQ